METATAAAIPQSTTARFDLYGTIHKALRLGMGQTLVQVGSADPQDAASIAAALSATRELLAACRSHLYKEDKFVHPLLEQALPGSSAHAHEEHQEHEEAVRDLEDLVALVEHARDHARGHAQARLYRALAVFVGENLQHMEHEEAAHNAALWAHYTDEELAATERALVSSVPPAEMLGLLRWFIPAMHAGERAGMLTGMRAGAPAPVVEAFLAIAAQTLAPAEYAKLPGA